MDALVLGLIVAIVVVGISLIFSFQSSKVPKNTPQSPPETSTQREPPLPAEEEIEEDGEDDKPRGGISTGKIGKKKAEKMKLKEEKRRHHEAMQETRRAQKEADAQNRQREQEERDEQKEKEEEEERQRALERKAKADEEYSKFMTEMSVEETGCEGEEEEENTQLLQTFVTDIQQEKVVHYQDLAVKYNITIERVVEAIEGLVETKELHGIFDERGKFISINEGELDQLAAFIKQRGRVSISEVTRESNRRIRLSAKESQHPKRGNK